VAYSFFAAITSDDVGYNTDGTVGYWFYDMSENFCLMTAVIRGNVIVSFKITDPYDMCGHYPAWNSAKAYTN